MLLLDTGRRITEAHRRREKGAVLWLPRTKGRYVVCTRGGDGRCTTDYLIDHLQLEGIGGVGTAVLQCASGTAVALLGAIWPVIPTEQPSLPGADGSSSS